MKHIDETLDHGATVKPRFVRLLTARLITRREAGQRLNSVKLLPNAISKKLTN